MATCSILNEDTKEPKIYFRTDRGQIFEDLVTTLNNTDNTYEVGFKDVTETFNSRATFPIKDINTLEGAFQAMIKNGFLKPNMISNNTFEATDELAAIYVEEALILNHRDGYQRNGNLFTIGDFAIKIDAEKYPDLSDMIEGINNYVNLQNEQSFKKKDVKYSEEQLMDKITDFMKRMGFSFASIESYKENYTTKFGIEPDARALVDLNNMIVAFANGDIRLEELSEEFSHFLVEMWDQNEIERMLQSVNNTKEYAEYAEHYRNIYSKQISDKALLEKAVRKEILGKILSNAIQTNFSTEGRNETEFNFLSKFKEILTKFFNYITGKLNSDLQSDIDIMSRDILNALYNNNLENLIQQGTYDPLVQVMYSAYNIDKNSMLKYAREMSSPGFKVHNKFEKDITELLNLFINSTGSSIVELENMSDDEVISTILHSTVERLNNAHDVVSLIGERIRKIDVNTIANYLVDGDENSDYSTERLIQFKTNVQNKVDRISANMNRMNGLFKDKQEEGDIEKIARMNHKASNPNATDEEIDEIINNTRIGIFGLQKDINKFWSYFVPSGKVSNLFVVQLQNIVARMRTAFQTEFLSDINTLVSPLKSNKDRLKDFVKEGRLITEVNKKEKYTEERRYELDIISKLLPLEYGNMTLEEYEKEWFENGLPEQLKDRKNDIFFEYHYEYWRRIDENKAADKLTKDNYNAKISSLKKLIKDGDIWEDALFQDLILESTGIRKASDVLSRREKTNPLTLNGQPKEGLEIVTYAEALRMIANGTATEEDFASINPNHALFDTGSKSEPRREEIIYKYDPSIISSNKSGQTAFSYMKWHRLLKENQKDASSDIMQNYRKAFDDYRKLLKLKGITDRVTINKLMMEWANNEILFENSSDYWENFNPNTVGIDFDGFYNSPTLPYDVRLSMESLEKEYNILKTRRGLVLKKHKSAKDYKEIDITSITPTDRMEIDSIEKDLSEKRKQIKAMFVSQFGDSDNMYKQSDDVSNVRLNKSYKQLIKSVIGKSFEDATADELGKFFLSSDGIRSGANIAYNRLIANLAAGKSDESIEKLKANAVAMGLGSDNDAIIKAFFTENSPIWAKRYDSTNAYDLFLTEIQNGNIDMEALLVEHSLNPNGVIKFTTMVNNKLKVHTLDTMTITPSYRHIVTYQKPIELSLQEYALAKTDAEKYEIIQTLSGVDSTSKEFLNDLSSIKNSPEELKIYIQMWDIQVQRLIKDYHGNDIKDLKRHNVDIIPQLRRTNVERAFKLFGGKFKVEDVKDWMIEEYTFREDDEEYAFQTTTIPRYGYRIISDEERSDDIYHAFVWGLKNANTRKQRVIHRDMAVATMQALEAQDFGKVDARNTNYHKMMEEAMDYNFYGKTTTFHKEISIPLMKDKDGNPLRVDIGKVAVWFRQLSVKAALKFSPITAATNFTSGWTNNILMSIVGHDIYGNANMRAFKTMNALMPGTVTDVGEFEYQSKANKLMYAFGYHDPEERYRDARFPKQFRILSDLGFAPMAITNYPLELQSILAKLMEYRLIDNKFMDWKMYKRIEKSKNPLIKESELKSQFNAYSSKSAYDFIQDDGLFDEAKLKEAGYAGDIMSDKTLMMNAIRNITERTTMEIRDINEGGGLRDPRLAFFTSMKKWMIIASVNMFSSERYDYDTLSVEKGIANSMGNIYEMFREVAKKEKSFNEAYSTMDEIDRVNIKRGMVTGGLVLAAYLLATMLKGLADDDDEKDNYLLQMATYMALRNLNELSGSTVGIGDSYYQAIKEPFMAAQTLKNYSEVLKLSNYGETTGQGKYEGINKGVAAIMKASSLKNIYNVGALPIGDPTAAEIMKQNYGSYIHFNNQDALYHIFSLIPNDKKDEK